MEGFRCLQELFEILQECMRRFITVHNFYDDMATGMYNVSFPKCGFANGLQLVFPKKHKLKNVHHIIGPVTLLLIKETYSKTETIKELPNWNLEDLR